VDNLAAEILKCSGLSVSDSHAAEIIHLYGELDDFDKKPIKYLMSHKDVTGRSKSECE